jgi:hypothetical protein
MRLRLLVTAAATALLAAGCQTPTDPGAAGTQPAPMGPTEAPAATESAIPPSPAPSGPAAPPRDTNRPDATVPARPASPYRVTYGWAVPARPVHVRHEVAVPVAPPPAAPLPMLVEVRAGDHPDEDYTRVTFAFRGGTPSYEVGYVRSVPAEGTGDPLPLPGNAFVRIRFTPAQAHDEQGRPTLAVALRTPLDFPTLRGYGFGGDFEGHLTFGLGLRVAVNSDQVLPLRIGELVRPDGSQVVAVDVRRG